MLKCEPKGTGDIVEARCEAPNGGFATNMTNNTEHGVLAELRRAEGFTCKSSLFDASGAEINEGSQTVNLAGGETLHVT